MNVTKNDWFLIESTQKLDLFQIYPVARAFCKNNKAEKYFNVAIKNIMVLNERHTDMYFLYDEWRDVGEKYFLFFKKDPSKLSEINKKIILHTNRLNDFADSVQSMPEEQTLEQCLDLCNVFFQRLMDLYAYAFFYEVLEIGPQKYLTDFLENVVAKYVNDGRKTTIRKYFNILTTARKSSWIENEHIDFLKMIYEIIKDNNNEDNIIKEHTRKYYWLPTFGSGKTWDEAYFYQKIEKFSNNPLKELQNKQQDKKNLINKQKKIEKILKLSETDKRTFADIRMLSYSKDFRRGVQNKTFLIMDTIIIPQMAKHLDVDIEFVRNNVVEELLQKNKRAKLDKNFAYVIENGVEKTYRNKNQILKLKKIVASKHKEKNKKEMFSGAVAYRGSKKYIKGYVKIILEKKDVAYFKDGDILVSHMTNPDIVEAITKSKAIITDMGGITCHVSIVARELKKPCIIGTKIATQVLKDGDLVEVDADEGVVRILEAENNKSPKMYERVFGGPKMPFLISDIITDIYVSKHKFFTTYFDGIWICYMLLSEKEKTLKEGVELYSQDKKFKKYKKNYLEFINLYEDKFKNLFSQPDKISAKEFKTFINLFQEAEIYYLYIQYFYTDSLDLDGKFDSEFGKLKERGRKLLNNQALSENNFLEKVLKKVAKTIDIDFDSLYFYSWSEIRDLLKGKEVSRPDQKERLTYVSFLKGNEKVTLVGEKAKSKIKQFEKLRKKKISKLSGTIANKGKVSGYVRILDKGYEHKNIEKLLDSMRAGEILIAETTSPEIMMACKKASAIVTNQGGMMSHAAIVSRELGIPCVVGAEIATQVLKDGDLVEVDADEGVVKILKKAENGNKSNKNTNK